VRRSAGDCRGAPLSDRRVARCDRPARLVILQGVRLQVGAWRSFLQRVIGAYPVPDNFTFWISLSTLMSLQRNVADASAIADISAAPSSSSLGPLPDPRLRIPFKMWLLSISYR
jgi:hypothetical protein